MGKVGALVLLALSLLLVAGAALWAADYGVEATVVRKHCPALSDGEVTVRTKVGRIEHVEEGIPAERCALLRAGEDGSFVVYHVRTERTILYEREGGDCLYDSARGIGC